MLETEVHHKYQLQSWQEAYKTTSALLSSSEYMTTTLYEQARRKFLLKYYYLLHFKNISTGGGNRTPDTARFGGRLLYN